jgi:hypothetical protein
MSGAILSVRGVLARSIESRVRQLRPFTAHLPAPALGIRDATLFGARHPLGQASNEGCCATVHIVSRARSRAHSIGGRAFDSVAG